ncbi:MAG: DUF4386 family protein [Chloroflexota bacterium]
MEAQSSQQPPSLRLFAILLMVGAVVGLVGNALHPHTADPDAAATIQAIAQSGGWVAIHLAIIVAILLAVGGFVGLTRLLESGPAGPLAQLGLAAALVGGAVVTVSTAMDGFAMKALALAWAGTPAAEAAAALRLASGVKEVNFAIWSIGMLVFFGGAFVCLGAALVFSGRFPVWFGWVAVVSGIGSAIAAIIQIANTGEVQAAETIFLASSVLGTLWIFGLGVLLWRAAPARSAGRAPVRAR